MKLPQSMENPYTKAVEEIAWSGLITQEEEKQLLQRRMSYDEAA